MEFILFKKINYSGSFVVFNADRWLIWNANRPLSLRADRWLIWCEYEL